MLGIAEQWYATDLGRQRQGNEDNLYVRAPLFVVADGMGGAQAGEVASEIAVRAFDRDLPPGRPAAALVRIIESANREIHDRSRTERQKAGMGTTVTAAYVEEQAVVVAHVGDSRAYRLRGGGLARLTTDHSLVEELKARGKLTEEQAETHPQRSVITRALGIEPDVDVDVQSIRAQPGDVFLLCSDGLTSMLAETEVERILGRAPSLEAAGRELIAAANAAGGRDNITVVLFRLDTIDAGRRTAGEAGTAELPTREHQAVGASAATATVQPPVAEASHAARGDQVTQEIPRADPGAADATGTAAGPSADPAPAAAADRPRSFPRPVARRRRRWGLLLVPVGLLAVALLAGFLALRSAYFLGTQPDGTVAVFRGLPYELPLGVELYSTATRSGLRYDQVAQGQRPTFTDHQLRSRADALELVAELERGRLAP